MKTLLLLPNFEESWVSVKLVCEKIHELTKKQYGEDLDTLHVERDQIFKKSKNILTYQKIICLDHSVETIKALKFVKGILKDDLILEFFALGMASSFYWPLKKFGLSSLLGKSDKIIVSCFRDATLTNYSLPNIPCEIRPFRFYEAHSIKKKESNKLVYIGRLSFLKNIHGLINFFKNYQIENPMATLDLIGSWDHVELPHFEIELDHSNGPSVYEDYIHQLIEDFNLKEVITFHGQKTEKEVSKWLKENNGTFISLSLQNDENYGLAADQALSYGHYAILSNWGGHAQLKKLFPNQVKLLETFVTKNGPGVLPSSIEEEVEDKSTNGDTAQTRQHIEDITLRREEFNQLKKGDVLFHDHNDHYYHFFCLKYSGNKEVEQREDGFLLFGCEDILKK